MNVTEAITEILRITARPDKTADALASINKALAFFTLKGEFPQDTVEATINISSTITAGTVALTSLVRFRRFLYIKPTGKYYYLTKLDSDKIFTPSGKIQPNRYYVAGTNLTYTLSELNSSLEIAYLQSAPILDQTVLPTHWMLVSIPYAVIDYAAGLVYRQIGDDASADRYMASGMSLFNTFHNDSKQP